MSLRLQYACMTCWDGQFFCSVFFCLRPPHPFPATSAPSPAGCLSLSRARVCLGAAELHTLSIFSEKLHSLPRALAWVMAFFFWPELHRGSGKAPRFKSAVCSMVITSGVLNPSRRGVQWSELCDGRESTAETDSKSLSCNGMIDSSLDSLCVHCSQHTDSVTSASLRYRCWSHLSPEEILISTHNMRSV